eukprot:TRINITY_DN8275_c0_g1_i1.p1 TRINITY_DN8275_c0_g1~~TRINITY_DN8275_c0_g1_i1.p1  ORF type:complete len:138 (-),score=23.68 TRINITY_DN8275_c0_g1_i1:236-649(-)
MAAKPSSDHIAKCQFIVWNLIQRFEKSTTADYPASMLVKELQHTAKCDDLFGAKMKYVRQKYDDYLAEEGSAGVVDRIRSSKPNDFDERIAAEAVGHLDSWTQHQLHKCLDWKNKLYYHTLFKAERTFAILSTANSR